MGSLHIEKDLTPESYSVPEQTKKLLDEGILNNPLISKSLPPETVGYGAKVKYIGSNLPTIAINWRFAESISSLKGLEATLVNVLLARKYGIEPQEVVINTDHAQLFIMSTLLWTIDPTGEKITPGPVNKYFPSYDIHNAHTAPHRTSVTNIYKTKDDRFFHLHGSMNPDPSLDSIGLPHDLPAATAEEAWPPFVEKMAQLTSAEMQHLATDVHKQAGTICWTADEFAASAHGKANSHVGLFDVHHHPNPAQKASWWPDSAATGTGPRRPLAGLKVVDVTRVIAAPTVTRGLAELGASVMRVTAPHLVDFGTLHCDLNWGKWNTELDFRSEADREKMRQLVLEADVVVTGYRPGVLDKWGFGRDEILKLCEGRERGVIFVRENCYGWNGPWSGRSGWQQISDACCGVSMEFGRAMGNDEPVTPVFPNSDYCTGVAGVAGILTALIERGEKGGSYTVDVALNYYSQWLVNSCGVYPDAVWQDVWTRNGRPVFRHYHNMGYTLPRFIRMLFVNGGKTVMQNEFFENRKSGVVGKEIRTVRPILQFVEGKVELGFNVGTRTNGVDQPRWPKDLSVEIIGADN